MRGGQRRRGRPDEPCSCGSGCDCGCCEGTEPVTPRTIFNRPGLDALAWRIGTQSAFLETMKAELSSAALAGLTTREGSDPSIALLDAWAVVADVLTFYQERIANEGYLRTATERRSVLELARLVGYAPRPGVASSVYLAYTLEEKIKPLVAPGSPVTPVSTSTDEPEIVIPAGARVQSVPGPGETQQPFETSEDLIARAAWNNLQVRLTQPQQPKPFDGKEREKPVPLYLQGIATNLKPNDPLLIGEADPLLYRVVEVKPDAPRDRTRVDVQPWWTPSKSTSLHLLGAEALPEAQPFAEVLREVVDRSSDLAALGISTGATARRVLSHLEPLQAALAAGAGEAELRSAVEEALPKLRESRATAESIGATRVSPWVAGLTAELEEALAPQGGGAELAAIAADPAPPEELAADIHLQTDVQLQRITVLPNVLRSLGKAPTQPPVSSLRLERDAATLLAPESDLSARLLAVARPELRDVLYKAWANVPVARLPKLKVCALRVRASVFGHNAPLELVRADNGAVLGSKEWDLRIKSAASLSGDTSVIAAATAPPPPPQPIVEEDPMVVYLDNLYPQIKPGGWIVLERPDLNLHDTPLVIATAATVKDASRAAYGISGKTTQVVLDNAWLSASDEDHFPVIRGTAVYAQCEELPLAEMPIAEPVCGGRIELDAVYDGLQPGRWLIVSGERTNVGELDKKGEVAVPVPGIPAAELVMLAAVEQGTKLNKKKEIVPGERTHTTLTLATPLAYCYKPETLTIYGNVAHATHGQTRSEVLGSGVGSKALQSFTLKQPPLTWVSAPTPSGIDSTLTVRVNDVRWRLAGSLAELEPADRSFILRTDDGGQTTVVFGNGERGARLPTGSENVRAVYRSGLGKAGNAKAGQISQLATRPLGVKDVINPLPATGGADPESRDQARRNTPLAVLALDRLISVQDYEDFTRTFAGVGKASAVLLPSGRGQLVHVTIAGEDDIPIADNSDLLKNLPAALRRFGDPRQPLQAVVRQRTFLVVQAAVRLLPDYLWEAVEPKIRAAMLDAFGFARRCLGQDALLSRVYATIQGVRGVDRADVDIFARKDPDDLQGTLDTGDQPRDAIGKVLRPELPAPRLQARRAWVDPKTGEIHPAELLYLTPDVADTLILTEQKS
jgi:predicted phage baseplate assembly protein